MMDCKRALADCEGDLEKATTLLRERGLAKAGKREGRATSEGTIGLVLAGNVGAVVDLGCETDFVAMNEKTVALVTSFAQLVADDASIDSAEKLMAAKLNGEPLEEVLKSNISTIGENLVIRRVERLAVEGNGIVGGYVHGGKLGVLVGLKTDASGGAVEVLAKDLAMHVAAADPAPVALDREGVPAELVEKERDFLIKQAKDSGKPDNIIEKMVDGRIGKYFSEICLLEQAFIKDPDQKVKKIVEAAAKEAGSGIEITGFVRVKIGEAASE
jgi:elongation factor Ts